MARDLLREYLVALGFNVDEASYKKFTAGVNKATAMVAELGETAFEAAAAIGYMVEKSARSYEELYYVSQRTEKSVAFLKSYEFAARQVGVTQEAARASTEAFAQQLRTNIGLQGLAAQLGISGADPAAAAARLKQLYGGQGAAGYMIAQRFGSLFGIDEKTFKQFYDNAEKLQEQKEAQARRNEAMGIGTKQMTEDFTAFERAFQQFETTLGNVKDRISYDLLGPVQSVVKAMDDLLQRFGELDKDSGGKIGAAAGIGGSVLGVLLIKKFLGTMYRRFGPGAGTSAAGLVAGEEAAAAGGLGLRGLLAGAGLSTAALMSIFYPTNKTDNDAEELARRTPPGSSIGARNNSGKTRGDRNNNPGNIEYGPWAVAHGAVGTDGRFAIFPDLSTGQAAMDELLRKNYAGLTLGEIQRKWVGNNDARYLGGLQKETGLGAGDRPDMSDPAVRGQIMRGIALGEGTRLAPSPAQAGGNVTINHDTDINIHGPVTKDTAGQILDAQADTYGTAVRNALPRTR